VALFQGKDRTGASVDWKGDGSASAFILVAGVVTGVPTSLGYRRQTVGTTAEALEGPGGGAIPTGATHVLIDVAGTAGTDPGIRMTRDGSTTPTASLGRSLPAGSLSEVVAADLADVSLISESGSITVDLEYLSYTS
jgi:hypothetical protein